jgi:hypothetical protein
LIKFKKCGINPLHPPNVRDEPKQREIMQGVGEFLDESIVVIEVYVKLMDLPTLHHFIFFHDPSSLLSKPNLLVKIARFKYTLQIIVRPFSNQ